MAPRAPSSTLFPYTTLFRSTAPGPSPPSSPSSPALRGDQPRPRRDPRRAGRSEEHTSELQSRFELVCRLLPEKKKDGSSYHRRVRLRKYPYSASLNSGVAVS